MNKYFSCLLMILIVFNSCNVQQVKTIAVERDTTIAQATSFSKLFLDSVNLEIFIKEETAGDSAAEQLRNFYKKRNYQMPGLQKMELLNIHVLSGIFTTTISNILRTLFQNTRTYIRG